MLESEAGAEIRDDTYVLLEIIMLRVYNQQVDCLNIKRCQNNLLVSEPKLINAPITSIAFCCVANSHVNLRTLAINKKIDLDSLSLEIPVHFVCDCLVLLRKSPVSSSSMESKPQVICGDQCNRNSQVPPSVQRTLPPPLLLLLPP